MSNIDWTRIHTARDLERIDEAILYDESQIRDPIDMRHLNPNLSEDEIEDAMFWKDFVNGIMLVTGDPGGGKGIFLHMLAYKMKYYFNKCPILDTRPRKVFGSYIPFSKEFLVEQIARMSAFETGTGEMEDNGKWFVWMKDDEGEPSRREILLRNSTVGLDEYGNKYMPRKQSNLAISIDLLKLYDFRRHLQCLTLGVGVDINDFNRRALAKANWEARCQFIDDAEEREEDSDALIFGVTIKPVSYDESQDLLAKGKAIAKLRVNAREPRAMLNGNCWKDIFNTQNAQGFDSAVAKQIRRKQ
jgi:hypothetical protein